MAGFQVIIYGRFWVIAEAGGAEMEGQVKRQSAKGKSEMRHARGRI